MNSGQRPSRTPTSAAPKGTDGEPADRLESTLEFLSDDDTRLLKGFANTLRRQTDIDAILSETEDVRDELRLTGSNEAMVALAEGLVRWCGGLENNTDAARVLLQCAEIAFTDLQDSDYAIELWERALLKDPSNTTIVRRATDALVSQHGWERLEVLLMSYAGTLAEQLPLRSELRCTVWRDLARIRAKHLKDVPGAMLAYRSALDILSSSELRAELAALHIQRAAPGDLDEAAQLYFELGAQSGGSEAVQHAEKALDCSPVHEEALTLLEHLEKGREDEGMEQKLEARYQAFVSDAPAGQKRDSVVEVLVNRYSAPPPRGLGYTGPFDLERPPPMTGMLPSQPLPRSPMRRTPLLIGCAAVVILGVAGTLLYPRLTADTPESVATPSAEVAQPRGESPGSEQPPAAQTAGGAQSPLAHPPDAAPPLPPAPSGPSVQLSQQELVIEGGELSSQAVAGALEPVRLELERCYRQALRRDPGLTARIQYRWSVHGRGKVVRPRESGGRGRAVRVRGCGMQALEQIRFPKPKGRPAHVRAVFELLP